MEATKFIPKITALARRAAREWRVAVASLSSREPRGQQRSPTVRPGRRQTPRFPHDRVSHSRLISLRMRIKTDLEREELEFYYQHAAAQRHQRLPLMTLQMLLQQQDLKEEPELSESLQRMSSNDWRDRLRNLSTRGWMEDDVSHWAWIVSATSGDARIERLITSNRTVPLFLIQILLQQDQALRNPSSIKAIVAFVEQKLFAANQSPSEMEKLDTKLTVAKFSIILRRLVYNAQKIYPRYIVELALFTRRFIESIPLEDHGAGTGSGSGYAMRCKLFNTALGLFKRPAASSPLANMEFNWMAQKILLSMSDNMTKPLIIQRSSYRAIRKVLIGLKKSPGERAVAMRYAKSWPPYRQDFDGHDAKRTPADDHSRSMKARTLMEAAGYDADDFDRALDVLSGSGPEAPSIQTRSLAPLDRPGDSEEDQFQQLWAMRVRATRNAQEAWRQFVAYASTPGLPVYTEMFVKLMARESDDEGDVLPGESQEVTPEHDANYSEYERARLAPPSLKELYNQMLYNGIKPEGYCLNRLVATSQSVAQALQFIRDSGLDADVVAYLRRDESPTTEVLQSVPILTFSAYIELLCELQPDRRGRRKISSGELSHVSHAITLTRTRLNPDTTTDDLTLRQPWYAIMSALVRPYVAVRNAPQLENDLEALRMFVAVFRAAKRTCGVDVEIFVYLCRMIQKTALASLPLRDGSTPKWNKMSATRFDYALAAMKSEFQDLVTPFDNTDQPLVHAVGPAQLHAYMRALAFLRDGNGMLELMNWVLKQREYLDDEAERMSAGRWWRMIAKTLCAFKAFGGHLLDAESWKAVSDQMVVAGEANPAWRWPTAEEIDDYLESDNNSGSRMLLNHLRRTRPHLDGEQPRPV